MIIDDLVTTERDRALAPYVRLVLNAVDVLGGPITGEEFAARLTSLSGRRVLPIHTGRLLGLYVMTQVEGERDLRHLVVNAATGEPGIAFGQAYWKHADGHTVYEEAAR